MATNKVLDNDNCIVFLLTVQEHLKEYGGKIHLLEERLGMWEEGSFCPRNLIIRCVTYPKTFDWVLNLAHEYAHFLQFLNDTSLWKKYQKEVQKSKALSRIAKSVKRPCKTLTKKQREKSVARIIDLELDCERRTLRLVKKFDLPANVKEYVQRANLILYKYLYWGEFGIWPELTKEKIQLLYSSILFKGLLPRSQYIFEKIPPRVVELFN